MNARLKRRLRVVEDCPQPEAKAKPIMYGAAPWSRLPPTPTADQITIRARAQSLMVRNGRVPDPPSFDEALRIIARSKKPRIRIPVTVPAPLSPRAAAVTDSGNHYHTLAGDPAEDWFNGPECAAILAQPVEPCTENPFVGDREPSEIDA